MTVDLSLAPISGGLFDIGIGSDGDLSLTDGLDTAVFASLLSDARATADQVPTPERRRGWLGDVASDVPERLYGSHLWLLDQRRRTQNTLNDAIDYARNALQWMQEDGLVVNVSVTGEFAPDSAIELEIQLDTLEGVTSTTYVRLWERTVNAN